MNAVGTNQGDWDKHFKLVEDIDLADGANVQFSMIGTEQVPFSGVFDGGGHKIANIRINRSDSRSHIGMFGHVMGKEARIEDLSLADGFQFRDGGHGLARPCFSRRVSQGLAPGNETDQSSERPTRWSVYSAQKLDGQEQNENDDD